MNSKKYASFLREVCARIRKLPWDKVIEDACRQNSWFTPSFVKTRLDTVLTPRPEEWEAVAQVLDQGHSLSCLAVVAAGNIPLVSWHDLICALYSRTQHPEGVRLEVKLSHKDRVLLPYVMESLSFFATEAAVPLPGVFFVDQPSDQVQALLFSGGNQALSHYRAHYHDVPLLERTDRTSYARLTGSESYEELCGLALDCFLYFGLGCRNVSLLCVPQKYDFSLFIKAVGDVVRQGCLADLATHPGWNNALRYARAVGSLSGDPQVDGGFFLLRQNDSPFAPMGVLHYTHRDPTLTSVDSIQCRVGETVAFGRAQFPAFSDFADDMNTAQWLQKL